MPQNSPVVEKSMVESIPEEQSSMSSPLNNSLASEDEFFLPFDDDIEATNDTPAVISSSVSTREAILKANTKRQVLKSQEQQQNRQAAMSCLEEFFLGESSAFAALDSSPFSVLEVERIEASVETKAEQFSKSKPASPKRNMFGQIIEEPKPLVHAEFQERPGLLQPALCNDSSKSCSSDRDIPTHQFAMLHESDRAISLPMECSQSFSKGLTRKSSMKKISSIGRFPSFKSEGSLKRNVSFGSLKIRDYNVALSDNPSCSFGPPVQLSWDYREREIVPLDSYEESRQPRRNPNDLVLSYYDRRLMLLKQAKCSKREVKAAMEEVDRVKRERLITDIFLPASPLDEGLENVIGTVKKYFKGQES